MLIKIAFRNIWRNKRRTSFCLIAVGATVFIYVVSLALEDGVTKSVNDTVQIFETGHVRVVSAQFEANKEFLPVQFPVSSPILQDGENWREVASSIHEIPGVRAVFPRLSTMATLQISTIRHATLWGIDIQAETAAHNFNLTRRDDGLVEGRWPVNANEAAVGIVFARRTGLHIGDRIPLRTTSAQFSDRMWSPVITGIFSFDFYFDQSVIITDFERLQRLLALDEGTQQLIIFADNDRLSPLIASEVQNLLGENSVVTDWNDNYFVAMQRASSRIYYIAYAALLILASFLIINTMVMIIHERIKEIGMMGSLGMTRAEVVKVFFFESVFLSCFGALCGVILGGTLTAILSHFPIRMGAEGFYGDMPMSNTIFFQFSFARLITAWIAGVVLTSIITLIPSLKSAFIEPVEALRR